MSKSFLLMSTFLVFAFTLARGEVFLDKTFFQNCTPKIGEVSCDGKIYIGENGGRGLEYFPENILGYPSGKLNEPQASEKELLSLGSKGWIIVKLARPVKKVRIFENPFYLINPATKLPDPHKVFCNPIFVELSSDGIHFYPVKESVPRDKPFHYYLDPRNLKGLAGVHPVYAGTERDAFLPHELSLDGSRIPGTGSGGDDFSIEDVTGQLDEILYIKLTDVGSTIPGLWSKAMYSKAPGAGFDLDTVVGMDE